MGRYSVDEAVITYKLKDASNWWRDINDSPLWQDRIFHILAALYGLVAAVALVCIPFLFTITFIFPSLFIFN